MRTKLLLIILFLSGLNVFAGHQNSLISLKFHDHALFTAELGGVQYNDPSSQLFLQDIKPGKYLLKVNRIISFHYQHGYTIDQVFAGYISIPPSTHTQALIDHHNRLKILSQTEVYPNVQSAAPNYGGFHHAHIINPCPPFYVHHPMSHTAFNHLMNQIANSSFDSKKLNIARQTLTGNYFTSAQILSLTRLFTFESYKLEFAKLAYASVLDKENYFIVNDAFTFSSSTKSLQAFTGQFKNIWN